MAEGRDAVIEQQAEIAPTSDDAGFVSLYRRFRPGRFAELRGQPHVVRALQGAVRDERVNHAYLFSGPRGTGKTSAARILARALNCAAARDGEPCGTCASCVEIARGSSLDVHELDAASNNGVDAMRELISHAALATPGRWKVYIVDEVHMLSNAAANALLKTLEEPPSHVVFVLATTDPQKVPATIRSRTQHLEFGLFGAETLAALLREVNDTAGLDLEEADLSVAVRKGRGSARDALSALDQIVASGSADALRADVTALTEAVAGDDAYGALVAVAALHEAGWGSQQIATELVDDLRQAFLVVLAPELCAANGEERERLANQTSRLGLAHVVRSIETLGRALVDMRDAPDARAVLEMSLVRLARPELDDTPGALVDRISRLERALLSSPAVLPTPASAPAPGAPASVPAPGAPGPPGASGVPESAGLGALRRRRTSPPTPPDPAPELPSAPGAGAAAPPDRDALVEAWGDHILRALPARAKGLFGAGRFVSVDGPTAVFALPNAMHRDKCEEVRRVVEEAINAHFGARMTLRLTDEPGVVDPAAREASRRRSAPTTAGSHPGLDPDDELDPEQPSGSTESIAAQRLLEAFPGAREVNE